MALSPTNDAALLQEVDEAVRKDRLDTIMNSYGRWIIGGVLAAQTSLAFTVQLSFAGPALATFVALAMVEPHVEHERPHYLENLRRGFTFAWRTPQVRYTVLLGSTIMMAAFAPVVLVQPFLIEQAVDVAE